MNRMFSRLLPILLLAASYAAPVAAQDPIVIKFSYVVAPETPKGRAALRFKQVAERRTNGRVKVELYPNSTLFRDDNKGLAALQNNEVQIMAPSISKVGGVWLGDFEVFDLPYIFPGRDLLRRVTDGPIGRGLLNKLQSKGVLGLAYWDNGFKVMSANRPLHHVSDFRGLKMRIQNSDVLAAQMSRLGAIPHKLAFSKVYEALKTGLVDGTENPPTNLYSKKMYEVQRHVTVSNHGYLGYAVITNKKFWDSLPGAIRIHLKLAMIDATRYANLYAERENEEALAKVRASGKSVMYDLSVDERNTWRKTLMSVHKQMRSRVGEQLLQEIYLEGQALGYKF